MVVDLKSECGAEIFLRTSSAPPISNPGSTPEWCCTLPVPGGGIPLTGALVKSCGNKDSIRRQSVRGRRLTTTCAIIGRRREAIRRQYSRLIRRCGNMAGGALEGSGRRLIRR